MSPTHKSDLAVLVADKNMEAALRALLARYQSLGIRPIQFDVFVHPDRDAGCLLRAHDFLRAQSVNFEHALVVFDRDGCGSTAEAMKIESDVQDRLRTSGWNNDRARAVVIDPELEVWVWSDSPHVDEVLGWSGKLPGLRTWLIGEGHSAQGALKPANPKAAVEAALRAAHVPRSSAIYQKLAERVSFSRCQDRAFLRLKIIVTQWFASPQPHPATPS